MSRAVATAFASALTRTRGGLSFTAIRGGQVIYDLRGGWADRGHQRAWGTDTAPTIFSGSKGLVAMCLAILADRGALELDAPVARYWPEFAHAGKSKITVRELASHRAGLPAVQREQGIDLLCSPLRAASLLAAQAPRPELTGVPCYHAVTFGWLCGELVRRAGGDPLAAFFAREIARPAGAEVWFGIPDAELHRAAEMFVAGDFVEPGPVIDSGYARRIFAVAPGLWSGPDLLFNRTRVRQSEIPGIGAIGTSLGVARCYEAFAAGTGGRPPLVSASTLAAFTTPQFDEVPDAVFGEPIHSGIGFELQTEARLFGPPADAFGHTGAGGSAHGYWPSEGVAFSFAINELQNEADDGRCRDVLAALHSELTDDSGH